MSNLNELAALVLVFTPLSLSAFGGGIAIISAMQHQVVDVYGWATGVEFLVLFAMSRGSPGPGSLMLATLIGWKVAGLPGALVATAAMFVPSSTLTIGFAAGWQRYRERPFVQKLAIALAPIGSGLVVAAVISLGQLASHSIVLLAIAAVASAISIAFPAINPLIIIFSGAVINVVALYLT